MGRLADISSEVAGIEKHIRDLMDCAAEHAEPDLLTFVCLTCSWAYPSAYAAVVADQQAQSTLARLVSDVDSSEAGQGWQALEGLAAAELEAVQELAQARVRALDDLDRLRRRAEDVVDVTQYERIIQLVREERGRIGRTEKPAFYPSSP